MAQAPELLAPAGSLALMRTAFAFGAYAIYAGQPRYSLRGRNNEFGDLDKLGTAIAEARSQRKRLFVVSNIFPHNVKVGTYIADMAPVIALRPDALLSLIHILTGMPSPNVITSPCARIFRSAG